MLYSCLISPVCATCPAQAILLNLITIIIGDTLGNWLCSLAFSFQYTASSMHYSRFIWNILLECFKRKFGMLGVHLYACCLNNPLYCGITRIYTIAEIRELLLIATVGVYASEISYVVVE
jgi:hypothetical protein